MHDRTPSTPPAARRHRTESHERATPNHQEWDLTSSEIGESPAALASGIELAEARLKELTELCDVELYRYRLLPTWRIIRLGPTLFVSAFDAGWEGHESATYKVMRTPHGPLYRGFRRMFEAMLADSERTL